MEDNKQKEEINTSDYNKLLEKYKELELKWAKAESEVLRYKTNLKNATKFYPEYIVKARMVARDLGYAIAVHGSEQRDLDLIAVPWTEDAKPVSELIEAIVKAVEGWHKPESTTIKSCGRLAHVILTPSGGYIDLSIIPIIKMEK